MSSRQGSCGRCPSREELRSCGTRDSSYRIALCVRCRAIAERIGELVDVRALAGGAARKLFESAA